MTALPRVPSIRFRENPHNQVGPACAVAAAKALQAERPRLSLRKIATRLAEQGFTQQGGKAYAAMSVRAMLQAG